MISELCNNIPNMTLLDFAYLSANVYHSPSDLKIIGRRPTPLPMDTKLNKETVKSLEQIWYQIKFPTRPHSWSTFGFQADFYIKVIYGEVRHAVIAVRGTDNIQNGIEDLITWGGTSASQLLHISDKVKTKLLGGVADIYEVSSSLKDRKNFDNFKDRALKQHSMDNLCRAILRSKRWASVLYGLQNFIHSNDNIN